MLNVNSILFRCSSLGDIMTESRSKSEPVSETAKRKLIELYAEHKYQRKTFITSKYMEKGTAVEEDAITLFTIQSMKTHKKIFQKNTERLSNNLITGEPDLYLGTSIREADETFDTKSSWSLETFLAAKYSKLDKNYEWQGRGYMMLTGAQRHSVVYCLVNSPEQPISDEKRKLAYQVGVINGENEPTEYVEKCRQIERNHIFDLKAFMREYPWFDFHSDIASWNYDIPANERIHIKTFERDIEKQLMIEQRVLQCRLWMQENLVETAKSESLTVTL